MTCYRLHCNNIMCDTYIDDIGYICNDCQEEFKEYLQSEGIEAKTEGQITRALKDFMATYKRNYSKGNTISVDDFFKSNTR